MILTGNSIGDYAVYMCNSEFELIGSETTQCVVVSNDSASFIPDAPVCRRKLIVYNHGPRHS